MKKISDIKGEQALDVLADMLEPAAEIMTDRNVVELARSEQKLSAIKAAIKDHKKAVLQVLAILDGENPDTYNPPLMALPLKLLEVLNDPDVQMVFSPQGQNQEGNASGSATESTEATVTK